MSSFLGKELQLVGGNSYLGGQYDTDVSGDGSLGGPTTTEDVLSTYQVDGASWSAGIDYSDARAYKIRRTGAGAADVVSCSTTGDVAVTANTFTLNGDAVLTAASGTGDVTGPVSSIDDRLVSFNGATGKIIKATATTTASGIDTHIANTGTLKHIRNPGNVTNKAVGTVSLTNLSTGLRNVAIGENTLQNITSNHDNVAVGHEAGQSSFGAGGTPQANCVFIGSGAGKGTATNGNNHDCVAVGYRALNVNRGGNYNTCVGADSGRLIFNGTGNTLLGFQSGNTLADGSYNTMLGHQSGVASVNLTNCTAVGRGAVCSTSNQITLGNANATQIRPFSNNVADLGSFDNPFKNLWLGSTLTTNSLVVTASGSPFSATAPGVTGTVKWDANYIYICIATNTWRRVAILSDWAALTESQVTISSAVAQQVGEWDYTLGSQTIDKVIDGISQTANNGPQSGIVATLTAPNNSVFEHPSGVYRGVGSLTTNVGTRAGATLIFTLPAATSGLSKFQIYTRTDGSVWSWRGPYHYVWAGSTDNQTTWTELVEVTTASYIFIGGDTRTQDSITPTGTVYTHLALVVLINGTPGATTREITQLTEVKVYKSS